MRKETVPRTRITSGVSIEKQEDRSTVFPVLPSLPAVRRPGQRLTLKGETVNSDQTTDSRVVDIFRRGQKEWRPRRLEFTCFREEV